MGRRAIINYRQSINCAMIYPRKSFKQIAAVLLLSVEVLRLQSDCEIRGNLHE